jgi:hypothetical protein
MPQEQNKPTARFGLASETWRTPILVLWAVPVCCVVIVPCCRQPLLSWWMSARLHINDKVTHFGACLPNYTGRYL